MTVRTEELLIGVLARLLAGTGHVAVGALSPIPGSAALLARALSGGATRVTMLGSRRFNGFTQRPGPNPGIPQSILHLSQRSTTDRKARVVGRRGLGRFTLRGTHP